MGKTRLYFSNQQANTKVKITDHPLKSVALFCAVISFSYLPAISFATQTETTENDDIVVTGRKIEAHLSAELGDFGRPVEIITGKDLANAGFVDLSMALKTLVPGLYSETRSGRGGYNTTSIHGSKDILWLLDGVRINNRLYGGGWSYTLSVHMIDRIEILKGGEGLFYGTGARAGVINIITKGITQKKTGTIGTSYGDKDYREVYGHVSDTKNGHGFMAFGSYEGWDGYEVLDDQVLRDANNPDKNTTIGYDRSTVGAKYRKEFNLTGKGVLSAQLRKQQGYFDYPYGHYRLGHSFNDWEEEIGILKWDHDLNDSFSYYIKSHFHFWSADCTFMNIDGSYRYNGAPWAYKDYGINFLTSTRWGSGEILSGIDYQNYWGKDEVVRIYDTKTTEIYGLFGSYRPHIPFSPKSKLAIGARYNITNEGVNSTIWDVSLKTPITGKTYFRSTVGTSFSVPTALQLYGKDPSRGRYGNPDLNPETSLNTEIGIGGGWQYFNIDAGYFSHDIEDMIKRITLANDDSTYKNQGGKTKIKGVEISTGIGPFHGVALNLSGTWVDAKNSGKQLEQIPEYYGSANVSYRNTSGWFGADVNARYTGDVYERGLGTFNDVNYGNVFVVDTSTFVRFGTNNNHKISLRVENIFDEEYASRYNKAKNTDGDYFLYHQNGLPLTVVLGYTFTF